MEKLFSTEDVHPRDRFNYWHEVACKRIADHDSSPGCGQSFAAEIEAGTLADIAIVRFANSSMRVTRAAHHIARAKSDDLFLCRQVAGTIAVEQEGREIALRAGELTLLDPMLPYAASFSSESNLLLLKLPRPALEARVGLVRHMVTRAIRGSEPEIGLALAALALLPEQLGRASSAVEEILREQTLDLVAVSLATTMQSCGPRLSSARTLVLIKVRAAVEARLSDPTLDARSVAAIAGVSVRYANAVLATQNTSIGRLIRERRLARCRRALEDPLQVHRTVSDIAYGWGFSDMTHFGRSFRNAYGMLPSEYRELVQTNPR